MAKSILNRILEKEYEGSLLDVLVEQLSPTDLQSLLLEVYRRRAGRQTPASLLAAYERNPYVRPSPTGPAAMAEMDRIAYVVAEGRFEPLDLAPVCPLGTNSVVATVDQNKAVATARNTELVSDLTNVLALECAVQRREFVRTQEKKQRRVSLCASHRLLRPQPIRGPATFPHFRLFGACTAGRDEGDFRFEAQALLLHLGFYLDLMAALAEAGFRLMNPRIALTDLTGGSRTDRLHSEVMGPLEERYPEVRLGFDPDRTAARNYYEGACFFLFAEEEGGAEYTLADGGFTPWTQQLLSDRKERLLISGIGTERVCSVFGPQQR